MSACIIEFIDSLYVGVLQGSAVVSAAVGSINAQKDYLSGHFNGLLSFAYQFVSSIAHLYAQRRKANAWLITSVECIAKTCTYDNNTIMCI